MRNSSIRVATFGGPGAEPVIRSVPWPQVPKNAALRSALAAEGRLGNRDEPSS
jgi:hypothetical protein